MLLAIAETLLFLIHCYWYCTTVGTLPIVMNFCYYIIGILGGFALPQMFFTAICASAKDPSIPALSLHIWEICGTLFGLDW